jgi:hypothetical protein
MRRRAGRCAQIWGSGHHSSFGKWLTDLGLLWPRPRDAVKIVTAL